MLGADPWVMMMVSVNCDLLAIFLRRPGIRGGHPSGIQGGWGVYEGGSCTGSSNSSRSAYLSRPKRPWVEGEVSIIPEQNRAEVPQPAGTSTSSSSPSRHIWNPSKRVVSGRKSWPRPSPEMGVIPPALFPPEQLGRENNVMKNRKATEPTGKSWANPRGGSP